MEMKKVFLLSIFLLTLLLIIEDVSAECYIKKITNADPLLGTERIIMEVSDLQNAHGKLYNSPPINNHYYVVCPTADVGAGTSQICKADDSNLILRLNSNKNSHAETKTHSPQSYNTEICYNDILDCKTTNSPNCDGGYFKVASLSSPTNAHIGQFSEYPTKICCSLSPPCPAAPNNCDEDTEVGDRLGYLCDSNDDTIRIITECGKTAGCFGWNQVSEHCSATTKCSDPGFPPGNAQCVPYCGNGISGDTTGEDCDDANLNENDGCNNNCKINPGWICSGNPSQCYTVYWTDGSGTKLSNTDSATESDTIKLVLETTNGLLAQNAPVTFQIYEEDYLLNPDDKIRTTSGGNPLSGQIDASGKSIISWTIDHADIVAGDSEDPGKFYFNAESGVVSKDSDTVDIYPLGVGAGVCGDGTKDQPNTDGINEECDMVNHCNNCACDNGDGFVEDTTPGANGCVQLVVATTCHDYCGDDGCNTNVEKDSCNNATANSEATIFSNPGASCGSTTPDMCNIQNCYCKVDSSDNCVGKYKTESAPGAAAGCVANAGGTCTLAQTGDSGDCSTDEFLEITLTSAFTWTTGNDNSHNSGKCSPIVQPGYVKDGSECRYDPFGDSQSCKDGTNLVQCPSRVKLAFFNWTTFITTLIFLVVVYVVWSFLDKKKRKKR